MRSLSTLKKMTEVQKLCDQALEHQIEKQENDRSYNRMQGEESGLGTTTASSESQVNGDGENTGATSGYDTFGGSGKTSWEDFEGELVNLSTFKLSILHSSNIEKRLGECEISSIEHAEGSQKLRKGKIKRHL